MTGNTDVNETTLSVKSKTSEQQGVKYDMILNLSRQQVNKLRRYYVCMNNNSIKSKLKIKGLSKTARFLPNI